VHAAFPVIDLTSCSRFDAIPFRVLLAAAACAQLQELRLASHATAQGRAGRCGLLFCPDDTMIHAVSTNLHAGHGWRPVSVYAARGMTWAHGEEMSPVVDLASTNTSGPQLSIGATPHVWGMIDIDFRARFSAVNTYEIKLGYGF